jgi:exodeoxyribonuclease VII large subunit
MDTLVCSSESPKLAPPLKVSELVLALKDNVERSYKNIRVVGEIASFKQWQSGHCYFDIKDEKALIPAVMFRPHFLRVPFAVKDGLEILFTGRLSVYPTNSRLQIIIESMEPLGQGALALAFIQLKEKLHKLGLFDQANKKDIKKLNYNIGIITSKHGAAVRDMIRIIKTRCPGANILLASVRVQGAGAKEEIAQALRLLDTQNLDVIILGRGGGSLEDLWAFNEEVVAEAIFAMQTPVISAVGHETDTTISDYVADIRAATPSHAAMLATPVMSELLEELKKSKANLLERQRIRLTSYLLRLAEQKRRIKDPRVLLFRHWQSLDELSKRINFHAEKIVKHQRQELQIYISKLQILAPFRQLRIKQEILATLRTRLHMSIKILINNRRTAFQNNLVRLDALSPLSVLARGFAVVKDSNNRVISSVENMSISERITIRLHDGILRAQVTNKEEL